MLAIYIARHVGFASPREAPAEGISENFVRAAIGLTC